ncbi:MAG TPA: hypothetical protein VMW71_01105 [Thermoplasmata archaeon]|nr:hypothetical protein [Thermoplasmata archaeon]
MDDSQSSAPPPSLKRWISVVGSKEAKKDRLEGPNIIGEIAGLVFISSLLWFFVAHKLEDTGFYTDEFGTLEMTMLFSAGGFAVLLAALRIMIRRRNLLRPLDVASFLLFAIAHAVLLARFPFDFEYVADALPSFLQWTVGWMNDTVGAIILALGIVGGIVGAIVTLLTYLGVREELRSSAEQQSQPPIVD